jgi:polar amino acid transport system ATP-binding protein
LKLKISNLSKRFEAHKALESVSLNLEQTHSLVLIGPSGGGKTTLLRILAGLEIPDNGSVELNDEPIQFTESALLRHRRTIGVVFQGFNLFPHLTALENIALPLQKVHHHTSTQARDVALQLLRQFQLDAHANKKPSALSGGQRQRVAIARAVANVPRLLLADEPTGNLDPRTSDHVFNALAQLIKASGLTVVLATHNMEIAARMDRRVTIRDGQIVEMA